MKPKVIAILCADIHLQHKPPIWRSNEPDWYAAMQRPLDEIKELQFKYCCPILDAGDVFDKWNSPAELINWALMNLPHMRSIAGQHDLPEHQYANLYRSAYETLVRANKIRNINGFVADRQIIKFNVYAFPFGSSIIPCVERIDKCLYVAIVHDYVWYGNAKYPNAPEEKEIPNGRKNPDKHMVNGKYYGYDVIVYGDNHKSFLTHIGKTTIFNCGTLMRRKSDEEDYKPQVGLLFSDGSVERYYLDTSKDIHLTADDVVKEAEALEEIDMEVFAEELRKLGSSALDFADAMKHFWTKDKTKQKVRDLITKAMEK